MHNLNSNTEGSLSTTELRNFGLILAGGTIIFFGLLFPLLGDRGIQLTGWPWILAFLLVVISLTVPKILGPVNKAWLFIGHILGYINTRIILGIIFILIFTPTALLLKLLGKDPMRRSLDAQRNSYRIESQQPKPENLTRPY
ncbi:MAG: sxtJ [Candidatus Electrothrix sp. AR4]|nr:sxtJ [Candidatus Electrothrix sp. AR4]